MLLLFAIILVFIMCISIFNYLFKRDVFARMTKEQRKKKLFLKTPSFWLMLFLISFFGILIIIGFTVYEYGLKILEINNNAI